MRKFVKAVKSEGWDSSLEVFVFLRSVFMSEKEEVREKGTERVCPCCSKAWGTCITALI